MLLRNSPAFRIIIFFVRCIMLNLLYLAASIAIITIPPATAAMFATARKLITERDVSMFRDFWRAFQENIKQSYLVFLFLLLVGVIVWGDLKLVEARHWVAGGLLELPLMIIGILVVSTFLNVFPLMVHRNQRTRHLLLNGFKLNFVKMHLSALNLLLVAAWYLVALHIPGIFVVIFFSLLSILTYWITNKKFQFLETEVPEA